MTNLRSQWRIHLVLGAGLLGLGVLLIIVGVALAVTDDIAIAGNVSSVLSLVLGAVATATALVGWWALSRRSLAKKAGEYWVAEEKARPGDHWVRSVRGADAGGRYFFTGRARPLSILADAASSVEPGLCVVTGMPGAGKSAVLAALVVRNQRADELPSDLRGKIPGCPVDVAVHARSKHLSEVIAELSTAVGLRVIDAAHEQEPLFEALRARRSLLTVIVDALDEAKDPGAIAEFLKRLSWQARVIVGVRPEGPSAADRPVPIPSALRGRADPVIDLSSVEQVVPDEVAEYVARRLRADHRRSGYGDVRGWTDEVLLNVIGAEAAAAAGMNFLIAQMITDELLSRLPVRSVRRGWSASMQWPSDFSGWMRRDLRRRLGDQDGWFAHLLVPLALAERGGLPVEIWLRTAREFEAPRPVSEGDLERTLQILGFFIVESGEGTHRYLLRHEQFAEYFRSGALQQQRSRKLLEIVLDTVPVVGGIRQWERAPEYAQENLLAHARSAGALSQLLVDDPALLAAVDAGNAADVLAGVDDESVRYAARIYRRSVYAMNAPFVIRAAVLEFHARLAVCHGIADAMANAARVVPAGRSAWSTPWRAGGPAAVVPSGPPLRTRWVLPVDDGALGVAAVVVDQEAQCTVIDLSTRSPLGPTIPLMLSDGGVPDMVSARATALGAVLVGAATEDGATSVWTLAGAGASAASQFRLRSPAPLRHMELFDGPGGIALLAAVGGPHQSLAVWPISGRNPEPILFGDDDGAERVLTVRGTDTAGVLLTASTDAGIVVRYFAANTPPNRVPSEVAGRVTPLRAVGDASAAVVLASIDGAIRALRLGSTGTLESVEPELGDGGPSSRPALSGSAELAHAAVADAQGRVRVWRLRPHAPALLVATHDLGPSTHELFFLDDRGGLLAASAWSGPVRIFAIDGGGMTHLASLHHGEPGAAVIPLGRTNAGAVLATRSGGGLTKMWHLDDGVPTHVPAAGGAEAAADISSLAASSLDEEIGIIAAAGAGSVTACAWVVDTTQARRSTAPDDNLARPRLLAHGEDIVQLATAGWCGGLVCAAGDTKVSLWSLTAADDDAALCWPTEFGVIEHLAVIATRNGPDIVAAAGPEGLQLWSPDLSTRSCTSLHIDPNLPVSDMTWYQTANGSLTVVAGTEDGDIHLLAVDADGGTTHTVIATEHEVSRVVVLRAGPGRVAIVSVARNGPTQVWDPARPEEPPITALPFIVGPDLATAVTCSTVPMLVTVAGSVRFWDVLGGPKPTLVHEFTALDGRPHHLVTTGDSGTLACAYTSGSIQLISLNSLNATNAPLNCDFSHLVGLAGLDWIIGTHGAALIAVRPLFTQGRL